jgi:hypothetical protein
MDNYEIIQAGSVAALETAVQAKIEAGYIPSGSLVTLTLDTGKTVFYQPVTYTAPAST